MELTGKKIAVLVEKLYEDQELWYPVYRFREAGAAVALIGPKKQTYESKHGYPATADLSVDEARASDYDALIVPGGWSPDHMRRVPAMVTLVRDVYKRDKPVAAICHGGWMLISADILRGVRVTGFHSIKDDLKNAGAIYEDAEVVSDQNVITSRTPADLPAFCRTLIAAVKGKS